MAGDLDEAGQRRHQGSQGVQLLIAEAARLLGGPARGVNRAVGRKQRQRDIVGDAFGAHLVEKRKAFARGIVDAMPDFPYLAKHDRQRAVLKSGRIQQIEIRGPGDDFLARLPDEIEAENIGMQRANEDADPPQRQAGPHQPLADFRHHQRRIDDGPRAVDQPVGDLPEILWVHGMRICGPVSGNVKAIGTPQSRHRRA